jgi:hypothetical protein
MRYLRVLALMALVGAGCCVGIGVVSTGFSMPAVAGCTGGC